MSSEAKEPLRPGIRQEEQSAESGRYLAEEIIDIVHDGLLVLDSELRVQSANTSFYEMFRVDEDETTGRLVYDLGNGHWDIPELRRLLEEVLPHDKQVRDYEMSHTFERIGERTMLLSARHIDHLHLILLTCQDITERKQAEARVEARVKARTQQLRRLTSELTLAEHRERHRIAKTLHDDLQQQLYGLQFMLDRCKKAAPPALGLLEEAEGVLREAIKTARGTASDLSPTVLRGSRRPCVGSPPGPRSASVWP